jgi:ribose transport system ATP-binding protein
MTTRVIDWRSVAKMTEPQSPLNSAISSERLLDVAGLTKRFTGTLALDHIDFDLCRGEVHALLGQNGAGKSTLIKILAGVYESDAGTIHFDNRAVRPHSESLPIAFIHQDLGLVDWMTVAENVAVQAGYPRNRLGLISWPKARTAAIQALTAMGSGIDPDAAVATLPAAERSLVAIGRALAVKSDILVLDEPTAALPESDVSHLLDALKRLRANGIGIIYVTHRLDEVFRIADRVTVLRDGRKVATLQVDKTSPTDLVEKIVGRSLSTVLVTPTAPSDRIILQVDRLVARAVGPVTLTVAAGEILGLVGLRGAGHHTIGRTVFGQLPILGGHVLIEGQETDPSDPAQAMRHQIGFVSSQRAEESIAANMSVRENIFLNQVATGKRVMQLVSRNQEAADTEAVLTRYAVKPREPDRAIATLSGGNQQKVVLARWMQAKVRLLILEEPTIGVDVGSKAEIYRLLQQSTSSGLAVLLVSSDFEEVQRICHRALVFSRGRVVSEISRSELTIARLTADASGGTEPVAEGARR